MSVVTYAPDFKTLKVVKDNEALPTEKRYGVNLADFDEVVVMATLHLGATAATVQAYFWSAEAGAFIAEETPDTVTVGGAGVLAKLATHRHPSVFFRVTGITGGTGGTDRVKLEVAGAPAYDKVG